MQHTTHCEELLAPRGIHLAKGSLSAKGMTHSDTRNLSSPPLSPLLSPSQCEGAFASLHLPQGLLPLSLCLSMNQVC